VSKPPIPSPPTGSSSKSNSPSPPPVPETKILTRQLRPHKDVNYQKLHLGDFWVLGVFCLEEENFSRDATPPGNLWAKGSNETSKKFAKSPTNSPSFPGTHRPPLWPPQNDFRINCYRPGPRTDERTEF
jgi:hypothetical protein